MEDATKTLTPVAEEVVKEAPVTPLPTPVMESLESPKKKKFPIAILFVFLFVLFLGLAYYAIFSLKLLEKVGLFDTQETTEQENTQELEENNEGAELVPFEGEVVNANLPANWSMEEYFNGEGTTMLTEGIDYTGLTGLKIFKDTTEIFYLKAIYGIGFSGCPSYAKFDDENPAYYTQILEDNEVSGDEVNVTDYTNSTYIQFEWLGKTFRRIGDIYNYDTIAGNAYFEPTCTPSLVSLSGLQFTPDGEPAASGYDYGATDEATEADLLIVDEILESMTLVN